MAGRKCAARDGQFHVPIEQVCSIGVTGRRLRHYRHRPEAIAKRAGR
jgi:hypothetical protein